MTDRACLAKLEIIPNFSCLVLDTDTSSCLNYDSNQCFLQNKASAELDSHLFVQAQTEIEHNVEATLYKSFLVSEEFAKLTTQQDGSSSKMSSSVTPQSTSSQSPKVCCLEYATLRR